MAVGKGLISYLESQDHMVNNLKAIREAGDRAWERD